VATDQLYCLEQKTRGFTQIYDLLHVHLNTAPGSSGSAVISYETQQIMAINVRGVILFDMIVSENNVFAVPISRFNAFWDKSKIDREYF